MSNDKMLKKGKVCILCNGCPENRSDSARVQKYFKENGWPIIENYQEADLILFNSCGLTEQAESMSINIIRKIEEERKKDSRLIVWGCLPKINLNGLRRVYEGPIFGEKELTLLDQMIDPIKSIREVSANYIIPYFQINENIGKGLLRFEGSLFSRFLKKIIMKWDGIVDLRLNVIHPEFYHIKIATGCLGNCSYCAVRLSRGYLQSKSIEDIMSEFNSGIKNGFKYFSLLGTDLGAYGKDIGHTLIDLLKKMIEIEGNYKIGLRNVNPYHLKDMLSELASILKSEKIWYIELPVESGSNRILKIMNRNYTINEYKEIIKTIRKAYPNIIIRTQMMVGFPSESENDFKETMHLLDDIIFDYVEVYHYSKRPKTDAALMDSQIPDQIIKQRFYKLYLKALLNRTPRKLKTLLRNKI